MHLFRLLHRRSKSEGDVSTLASSPAAVTAPVFVPIQRSFPSFDPARELYNATPTDPTQNERIAELELQLARLRDERSALEQDLDDYRTDLFHARTELYSEMLRSARHQQRTMDHFRTIQKLEARHQRFFTLLVDIGISRTAVDAICQIIQSGHGSADEILVEAIKDAANDDDTLLARLKPIIKQERTPEHYQSALNLTLSIRKELRSQKKRSKFWKKLAQEDDRHVETITPSPSEISSIRQDLSPHRRNALDLLVARRRAAKCLENTESDVFGGQPRESVLDTLANSLASRPRRSIQEDLRLSSSFSSSSASSASSYLLGISRIQREAAIETPTISSRLPFLTTSLRRSSGGSAQSIVLGSINLNVSRSSSIDPVLPEEMEQHPDAEGAPVSTITLSQDLLQNARRTSYGNGHRRMSLTRTSSRRSLPPRSIRPAFRLSAISPIRNTRASDLSIAHDSDDVSGNTTIDAPSFETPDVMRLSDLVAHTDTDTPASSAMSGIQDTPFSDTCSGLPGKYGTDTPFSPMNLETQVASTPLDVLLPMSQCKEVLDASTHAHARDSRFLEHMDYDMMASLSLSASVSVSSSKSTDVHGAAVAQDSDDHHDDELDRLPLHSHHHADAAGTDSTIPVGESKDSLFTASASSLSSANDTPAPQTPGPLSPAPDVGDAGAGAGAGAGGAGGSEGPSPTTSSGGPQLKASSIGRRSMLPVLAKHLRRLSLSASATTSPERRLVDKLRGLRSLSRPRSRRARHRSESGSASESASTSASASASGSSPSSIWRRRDSPATRSDLGSESSGRSAAAASLTASASPSPIKGSGIPVLQRPRRTTIRACARGERR